MTEHSLDFISQLQYQGMLHVHSLSVSYRAGTGSRAVLRDISLDIAAGESVALLGESGSGKTTLAHALTGLLPDTAFVQGGFTLDDPTRVAIVFQEPGEALHPFLTVETQIDEIVRAHFPWSRARRREEIGRLLAEVGLPDDRFASAYIHQLSGGQRQRVAIAQALALQPHLLIADEPTASLDTVTERAVFDLIRSLQQSHHLALLWITHSPLLAASMDRVLVLRDGTIVEEGTPEQVLREPRHPFTAALLRALPPRLEDLPPDA